MLEQSGIVANCRMNRERTLSGTNGYDTELGYNPFDLLLSKLCPGRTVGWLDLCCGSGRALIEAANHIQMMQLADRCEVIGVDLVGMFARETADQSCLKLVTASLTSWYPNRQFEVISCVHGLHYIGDKLGLISRAASWLTEDGVFLSNLSMENIKLSDGRPVKKIVAAELRKCGLVYDATRKRVFCHGRRQIELPFRYLGSDDQAGPNYTGQPAVDSYYELLIA
ncbi:MAG: Methyltransferase domain protein [Planctomycetaceae bacterium]|nr:Methyltransferase domain protein [Planctomycetaceae bacterium]